MPRTTREKPATKRPKKTAPDAPATAARATAPTEQDIRLRAYEIYQVRSRAGEPGDALSDWLKAENQLVRSGLRESANQDRASDPAFGIRIAKRSRLP